MSRHSVPMTCNSIALSDLYEILRLGGAEHIAADLATYLYSGPFS